MQSAASLPFLLQVGKDVAFVPPAFDAPRYSKVASVQMRDERTAIVTFDNVDDIDVAERLVGCHCLVHRAGLSSEVFEEACFEWRGWEVYDAHAGLLGLVEDLEERPFQSLLSIKPAAGSFCDDENNLILIPFVDAFVRSVDEDACRINVDVPSGLLDL